MWRRGSCHSGAREARTPESRDSRSAPKVSIRVCSSCPDLIRASIKLHETIFEGRWMAGPSPRRSGFGRAGGSSPAMTTKSTGVTALPLTGQSERETRPAPLLASPDVTAFRGIGGAANAILIGLEGGLAE